MAKSCIIDTNILLNSIDLDEYNMVYCPITVLEELDKLKVSDNQTKAFKARAAIRKIDKLKSKIEYTVSFEEEGTCLPNGLTVDKPDNRIVAHALLIQKNLDKEAVMLTLDLNMIEKCRALGVKVKDLNDYKVKEIYKGYKTIVIPTDEELSYFYENLTKNTYELKVNEYLRMLDKDDNTIATMKWDGYQYVDLQYKKINTSYIGTIAPYDEIQKCCFDSMFNNDITCLYGRAGSGKTLLALSYALYCLKIGSVNKIYVLTTCKELKGTEQIG